MIDTISVHLSGKMKSIVPPGWKKERWVDGIINEEKKMIVLCSGRLRHTQTGLRLGVNGGEVRWAEAEMSRLLFDCNGILIKTQDQLDQAIARLLELVSGVCDLRPNQEFRLTRIDLVGHAKISPAVLVRVYKNHRLPGIHRDPVHYPGESLFWKGSKRKCRIYDKKLRQMQQHGDVARIEWELHGRVILGTFKRPLTLGTLQIEECYKIYYNLSQAFKPKRLTKKLNLAGILAMANKENWCSGGVPLIEHVRGWKTQRYFRDLQKRVVAFELNYISVDLSSSFPPSFQAYQPVDVPASFNQRF